MQKALARRTAVPAFNIPYLPIMEPVVQALKDTNTFGLIDVARLEWIKFESGSLAAILAQHVIEDVSVEDPPLEEVIAEVFHEAGMRESEAGKAES